MKFKLPSRSYSNLNSLKEIILILKKIFYTKATKSKFLRDKFEMLVLMYFMDLIPCRNLIEIAATQYFNLKNKRHNFTLLICGMKTTI